VKQYLPGSDRPALTRLAWLVSKMGSSRRPLSTPELAAEYEVSQKTIRRDIDTLRDEFALPIETSWGGRGKYAGYYIRRGSAGCCPFCQAQIRNDKPLVTHH
jgi:predicted DNA-binding transcriptional regulator YafY